MDGMRSTPTDPFVSRPSIWRILRRMTRRADLWMRWLAMLGLLAQSSILSRWLATQLNEIEQGLRSALVLACPQRATAPDADAAAILEALPDASGSPSGGILRRPRFSMSLAHLTDRAPRRDTSGNRRPRVAGTTPEIDPLAPTPEQALAARMAMIADVLADPEPHIGRMRQCIARLGLRLRARPTRRPGAAPVTPLEVLATHIAPGLVPPLIDTS